MRNNNHAPRKSRRDYIIFRKTLRMIKPRKITFNDPTSMGNLLKTKLDFFQRYQRLELKQNRVYKDKKRIEEARSIKKAKDTSASLFFLLRTNRNQMEEPKRPSAR